MTTELKKFDEYEAIKKHGGGSFKTGITQIVLQKWTEDYASILETVATLNTSSQQFEREFKQTNIEMDDFKK